MKNIRFMMSVLLAVSILQMRAQTDDTQLPYFCGFESESEWDGWTFVNEGTPSMWAIGGAAYRYGSQSLYVTSDSGATAGYKDSAGGYYISAYRKFTVGPGSYILSFDCRAGGETAADGTVRDGLAVAWMPASMGTPGSALSGVSFPSFVTLNRFSDDKGRYYFHNMTWENITGTIKATSSCQEYYLVFVWKANGGDYAYQPGACIDNVQIGKPYNDGCAEAPSNLRVSEDKPNHAYVIEWDGIAKEYELAYVRTNASQPQQPTIVKGLTVKNYTLSLNNTEEGVYNVRVRSICDEDTSIWSDLSNVIIYNAEDHCLNFIDIHAPGVEATYGDFANPYSHNGIVDHGSESSNSIHTVHTVPDEYDPRTGYQLKTVPKDAVASVRISNWAEVDNVASGSIAYTYTVTDEADVLKVRYAAVLQYEDEHEEEGQTRIIVEVFDAETGELLSPCTRSEFNAKGVSQDKVRQWHEYVPPEGLTKLPNPIMWSDWSLIGINLGDYVGRKIKIRITLRACVMNYHFAYAYFVLDCDDGKIDGVACGEHPDTLSVPEGFYYHWYKTYDPIGAKVSDENFISIAPDDTSTYSVRLIFPEDSSCYFTLTTSTLPQEPAADMQYSISSTDCRNQVTFSNTSSIYGIWNGDTIPVKGECRMYEWDLGTYGGVSTESAPVIQVPAAGDTFSVRLRVSIDSEWLCTDEKEFVVHVPSILSEQESVNLYVCGEDSVIYNGVSYAQGIHEISGKNRYGCDSIVMLNVMRYTADTVDTTVTICSGEIYDFGGIPLTEEGHYEDTLRNEMGCDSVIKRLDLYVRQSLVIDLAANHISVCADYGSFLLPFRRINGETDGCAVSFGETFPGTDTIVVQATDTAVTVSLPEGIVPGRYSGEAVFFNVRCGNSVLPFTLDVLYPDSILVQRWNDVLAIRNADYNGGYVFSTYEWYHEGEALEDEVSSVLYREGGLDFGSRYRVLLERKSDGVRQFTCDIVPIEYEVGSIEDIPRVWFHDGVMRVSVKQAAQGLLYGVSGQLVRMFVMEEGENDLTENLPDGVYVLQVVYADGRRVAVKVLCH